RRSSPSHVYAAELQRRCGNKVPQNNARRANNVTEYLILQRGRRNNVPRNASEAARARRARQASMRPRQQSAAESSRPRGAGRSWRVFNEAAATKCRGMVCCQVAAAAGKRAPSTSARSRQRIPSIAGRLTFVHDVKQPLDEQAFSSFASAPRPFGVTPALARRAAPPPDHRRIISRPPPASRLERLALVLDPRRGDRVGPTEVQGEPLFSVFRPFPR